MKEIVIKTYREEYAIIYRNTKNSTQTLLKILIYTK